MLILPLKLPSFNAVAAGQTANVSIPVGPTYRQFMLYYKRGAALATEAQIASDLKKIRIKINGVSQIEVSAADLITDLKYNGFSVDAGVLPIMLAWPTARTPIMEEALAWGTQNVDTLNMEVDIDPAAVAPALELVAWTTPDKRPLGPIIKITTITEAAAASGTFEYSQMPRSIGDLARAHFHSPNITNLELQINGSRYIDSPIEVINASYKWTGRVPQAGVVTYDPCWLDRYDDRVPLADKQDVRFKLNMSAAGVIRVVTYTIAAPLGVVAR